MNTWGNYKDDNEKGFLEALDRIGRVIQICIENKKNEEVDLYLNDLVNNFMILALKKINSTEDKSQKWQISNLKSKNINQDFSYNKINLPNKELGTIQQIPKGFNHKLLNQNGNLITKFKSIFLLLIESAFKNDDYSLIDVIEEKYFLLLTNYISAVKEDYFIDSLTSFYLELFNKFNLKLAQTSDKRLLDSHLFFTYDWFINLQSHRIATINPKLLSSIENSILKILANYIEYGYDKTFERFCHSLSSRRDFGIHNFNQNLSNNFEFNQLIESFGYKKQNKVKSIYSFKDFENVYNSIRNEVVDISEKFDFENKMEVVESYIESIQISVFDSFKSNFLKILLNKAIVFSIFKNKPIFLKILDNYFTPADVDATWIGTESLASREPDIIYLLSNNDNILNSNSIFHFEGHHGFKVYLNTLLAYYIERSKGTIFKYILVETNKKKMKEISFGLENLIHNPSQFTSFVKNYFPDFNSENFKNELKIFKEKLDLEIDSITEKEIIESNLSSIKIDEFNSEFLDSYSSVTQFKSSIIKKYGKIVYKTTQIIDDKFCYGFNQLLNKQTFIEQNDIHYIRTGNSFGESIGLDEDKQLYFKLKANCKVDTKIIPINLKKYLESKLEDYDLILTSNGGVMDIFRKHVDENIYDIEFKNQKILSHFNFRALNKEVDNYIILLNTSKIGELNYFKPLPNNNFPIESEDLYYLDDGHFVASIIDISKKDNYFEILNKTNQFDDKQLKKSVWLLLYMKFDYKLPEDFNGIIVKIEQ